MKNLNKQRRNFISLSKVGYGSLEFKFRSFRLHITKEVGIRIIAIKTERMQIHFLDYFSDVLFAVASLDLKVLLLLIFLC